MDLDSGRYERYAIIRGDGKALKSTEPGSRTVKKSHNILMRGDGIPHGFPMSVREDLYLDGGDTE